MNKNIPLMKNTTVCFVFSFALLMVMGAAVPVFADTITVRADTWMPYNGEPNSDRPGYCIEMLKVIFEPMGYKIDYQIEPWTRATANAEAGKIDAIIGAAINDCPTCL
jgi:polar amino acid transport system substrate-binding protein